MRPKATVAGRSFLFNVIFVALNIVSVSLLVLAFRSDLSGNPTVLKITGFAILLFSIFGLIVFKGRIAIGNASRVIVGSIFIVSGLVKANDPIGFSYKLQEYFEDGALAYRIKEWFNMPEFSLEGFGESALSVSVLVCIFEITLGILVVLGQRLKGVSVLIVGLMLFFTFLTWHTDNCRPEVKFTDRNRYELADPVGQGLLKKAKTDKSIKIVSRVGEIVVDETMSPQCVNDCGCFGDAMKGSIGRSLTPTESYWKDLVLLYFSIWILLAAFKKNQIPGKKKLLYWLTSLALIALLSWLFAWWLPILFAFFSFIGGMWILRKETTNLKSFWYLNLYLLVLSSLLVAYVLLYEPLKDYRAYAVGSNLSQKMNDGKDGVYLNFLTYRNSKSGKKRVYDANSKEYSDSKIWENKDWKYISSRQEAIVETRLSSITEQFNPFLPYEEINNDYLQFSFITDRFAEKNESFIRLYDKENDTIYSLKVGDTKILSEQFVGFRILDTVQRRNEDFTELNIREDILKLKKLIILSVRNLNDADWSEIEKLKDILKKSQKDNIPMIMLVSSSMEDVRAFKKKYNFSIPVFITDETELKAIARSNPSLLLLKKGIVKGKFPKRAFPNYKWLELNVLK
ncbi:MAG: hypothetical protein P8M61_03665 [Crocinitomicaceae bacterium]|nr:hypothetical protein [Crocinitomicaceae bacterium]